MLDTSQCAIIQSWAVVMSGSHSDSSFEMHQGKMENEEVLSCYSFIEGTYRNLGIIFSFSICLSARFQPADDRWAVRSEWKASWLLVTFFPKRGCLLWRPLSCTLGKMTYFIQLITNFPFPPLFPSNYSVRLTLIGKIEKKITITSIWSSSRNAVMFPSWAAASARGAALDQG